MGIKTANPNFFIVRIDKKAQKEHKEGTGLIKRAATFTFGRGGMQHGEIVSIGKLAQFVIPRAMVGGTLYFSWKVEFNGEDASKPNLALVHEDETYNYYTVTVSEYKSRASETYAYEDERGIITHPSYILLAEKPKEEQKISVSAGGILTYDTYKPSDDEIRWKIQFNTNHIHSLSVTHASLLQTRESESYPIKQYMQRLEQENKYLTELLQGKEMVEDYTVAYCNPLHDTNTSDTIKATNIFFLEKLKIRDTYYHIGLYKHVHMVNKVFS